MGEVVRVTNTRTYIGHGDNKCLPVIIVREPRRKLTTAEAITDIARS